MQASSRLRHWADKSLVCLLQELCGHRLVVEIRNDTAITGDVVHVDNGMK